MIVAPGASILSTVFVFVGIVGQTVWEHEVLDLQKFWRSSLHSPDSFEYQIVDKTDVIFVEIIYEHDQELGMEVVIRYTFKTPPKRMTDNDHLIVEITAFLKAELRTKVFPRPPINVVKIFKKYLFWRLGVLRYLRRDVGRQELEGGSDELSRKIELRWKICIRRDS